MAMKYEEGIQEIVTLATMCKRKGAPMEFVGAGLDSLIMLADESKKYRKMMTDGAVALSKLRRDLEAARKDQKAAYSANNGQWALLSGERIHALETAVCVLEGVLNA